LYLESHKPLEDDTISASDQLQAMFDAVALKSAVFDDEVAREQARLVAAAERGVPVRVLQHDLDEVYDRARLVRNTVEVDPDVPTLAEVREILDAPLDETEEVETSAEVIASENE
jgi:hypothetical protein